MLVTRENKDNAEIRGAVYRILSLGFSPPSGASGRIWDALNSMGPADRGTPYPKLDLAQLGFEYNRLFVGPERLPCAPYESVHRKDRSEMQVGTVLGPSSFDVERRYARAGVEVPKDLRDLPDHIAIELEFMHNLCSRELECRDPLEAYEFRRMQEEFLKMHLAPWVFSFADLVFRLAKSPFYKKLASVLMDFMNEEQDYLGLS